MRVAFGRTAFALQRRGGLTRYFCRLAAGLRELPGVEARVFAPLHDNDHLSESPRGLAAGFRLRPPPGTRRAALALARRLEARAMTRFRPGIVHETYYDPAAFAPPGARRAVTVLDMIHERFPDSFPGDDPIAGWKRIAVERADRVICISESTRRDLLEFIPAAEGKCAVVRLGFDPPDPGETAAPADAAGRPRLLFVGQRGGYKNFSGLLRAWAGTPRLRGEFDLVCFGGGPFTPEESGLIEAACGAEARRVRHAGGDDFALAAHYRGAAALVYPSLYEGFGLPPLEAMARDCPVVCANASSLPEVAGGAAEYFDPAEPESLAAAIERAVFDRSRRAELIRRGRARLAEFSWARCARETLAVYRAVS